MLILQGIPAYCEEELGFIPIWEEQGDQAATAEKNGEKPEPALPVTDTAAQASAGPGPWRPSQV